MGDLRTTDFGSGYDLAAFIFSEFNVFKPADANLLLKKAYAALKPGGKLLMEVSKFDAVYDKGNQPATWYSTENELFADAPHLCLMESFWDDDLAVATERYYIVDIATHEVARYASSTQAYEDDELVEMLARAGFQNPEFYPSLTGKEEDEQSDMQVLVGMK